MNKTRAVRARRDSWKSQTFEVRNFETSRICNLRNSEVAKSVTSELQNLQAGGAA
jgi:hypothetical protein